MAAITWQNINFPSNRDVGRELDGAQKGIGGAFDILSKVLTDRQAVGQGVDDRSRAAGAQDYLNILQGFKTPEELQAARLSGQLDQAFARVDVRNQAEVRGAAEARIAGLQTQTNANNTFAVNQVTAPVALANAQAAADNAPIQRELDRNDLVQRQTLQPITNETAVAAARNAGNAETLKAELFPVTSANAKTEARITSTRLPVQLRSAENDAQDQLIQQLTSTAAQQHQDRQLAGRLKLAPVATKLGLTLDSAGSPDYLNYTKEDRAKLQEAVGSSQVIGDLYSGDTRVANSFLTDIRKDPRVTSEAIGRNQARITGAFSTVGTSAPIGNDALLIDRRNAQNQVRIQEEDSRNRYAPGSPDALNAYEKLAVDIQNDPSFKDSPEDLPHVQRYLQELSTKGLEVEKGKFIVPSAQDVLAAVRGTYEGWNFRNRGRQEDIAKALKNSLTGSNVSELLKQREESLVFKRQQAVRDILNPVTPAMAPLNPLQIPPNQPSPRK